jgi:alcohol dehydrogenase YqhD (iron-dependent ADH family)
LEDKKIAMNATKQMKSRLLYGIVLRNYYRFIMPYGLEKFKRFAEEVWGSRADNKSDQEVAEEGLLAMENWMKKLGLTLKISELGVTEDMIEGIADGTIILEGGYKVLTHEEVVKILRESM